jgi:hypothetical protein
VGAVIYDAVVSKPWPGMAAVSVSIVHLATGQCVGSPANLDGAEVPAINSRLLPKPERRDPARLIRNSRIAFVGTKISGQGFIVTPEDIARLRLPKSLVFPYAGGEDVTRLPVPAPSRWVINFGERDIDEARRESTAALKFIEERVRPERTSNSRPAYRDRWWRFGEPQAAIYTESTELRRILVISEVSKHLAFAWLPTGAVYAHTLTAIVVDCDTAFAVLQSRLHEKWTRMHSSSLEDRLRYIGSDCFDTFPFPQPDPRAVIPAVETAGKAFYETRARFMVTTDQGLTKTYNALKDPENTDRAVLELRRLTEAMDRAVLDAYGWTDLAIPPYCPQTDADRAAIQAFEDEVIDRLYILNADRAAEEQRLGLGKTKKGKQARKPAAKPADDEPADVSSLKKATKKTAASKSVDAPLAKKSTKKATAKKPARAHADLFAKDRK